MLIVRLDAIGDALVTVPLVAALKGAGFGVSAVLCPANAQAFAPGALDRVHVVSPAIAGEIARHRYDAALIPSEEPQAYALARDARIPQRVGFWHGLMGKPFKSLWIRQQCTRVVYRDAGLDTAGRHECEVVFDLARWLLPGSRAPRDAAVLRPVVLETHGAETDARVAFQVTDKWTRLGASFEDLVMVAGHLAESHDVRYIGAAAEAPFVQRFAAAARVEVETFTALSLWKAAIAQSRALVAPDSGAVHVAGMTGTPVVAVYGGENFVLQVNRWRPWAAPNKTVEMLGEWTSSVAGSLKLLLSETEGA